MLIVYHALVKVIDKDSIVKATDKDKQTSTPYPELNVVRLFIVHDSIIQVTHKDKRTAP